MFFGAYKNCINDSCLLKQMLEDCEPLLIFRF